MRNLFVFVILFLSFVSCSVDAPDNFIKSNEALAIYPDYSNTTVPFNIAPINFLIDKEADAYVTKVYSKKGHVFNVEGKKVLLEEEQWKELLLDNKGDSIYFQQFLKTDDEWIRYPAIAIYIAPEPIDDYIVYRLIQPLYVTYHKISIKQRDLTSFEENSVYDNRSFLTDNQGHCVNCHSFQDYNRSGKMQMHFRNYLSGTLITKDNKLEKVNIKTDSTISGGVYPSWHPSEDLIAYSVNKIFQNFHTKDHQKTEVQDSKSGIILYDINKNEVRKVVDEPYSLETFPYWSPDGKTLFFASADHKPEVDDLVIDIKQDYERIKYNLCSIPFDIETFTFGTIDTVFNASAINKSATFPRLSPNGKHMLFTMADFGNFHIWHKSSDLYLKNMETGFTRRVDEINSNDTESYHSWSSNGNWIIFSSRRLDGAYTRFFIAHFNDNATFSKPFVLPQKDPGFYIDFFKSYNIPEFIVKPVAFSPNDLARTLKTESSNAKFVE